MKIAILTSNYPGIDKKYGDVFVHHRAKAYQMRHEVEIFGVNENTMKNRLYTYEGISVSIYKRTDDFYNRIKDFEADLIAVHFVHYSIIPFLTKLSKPLVFFLHGFESLTWRRRLMNYSNLKDLRYLLPYIIENCKQLKSMRKLIKLSNQSKSIHFVFVSSWLKDASSHDLRIAIDNSSVIPNGIDTKMFKFQEKPENFRKNVLLLRSFKGKNYANDVSVDAIHILSRKPFFNQMQFNIYGEGYLYPRLTKTLKNFSNVFLNNHYVHNHEMPALHEQNGIFLCPSRLDTQGVLMCEAMASGLVPITSPIGGIPEYTEDAIDSFYVTSPGEMAEKLEYLFYHPIEFLEMSRNARLAVERKCSINQTVDLELSLFSALVANN